jgi:Cd2+/Zn2+-exporting ATPase
MEMRRRLAIVCTATAFLIAGAAVPWIDADRTGIGGLLAAIGMCIVAAPIVWQTITAMRATGFAATQFYMDQYVVLAMGACAATGQYLTGGIVAVILVLGQMLEERTVIGVEYAISRLRELGRMRARRIEDGSENEVEASALAPGDLVRIRPGDAIPADAVIEEGEALVNQSNITGESLPIEAGPGDRIFAGTTNLNGLLTARVAGSGGDTVMARVQRILEEAKETEAPIIRMAEDYARYYTPLVLVVAASVYLFSGDINRAISVLIVSIPCAFVLASPSALVTAIACASRLGLLVKGARHLEDGKRIDTVVFDKTGTLTQGALEIERVWLHGEDDRETILGLAAALERHSNHPVAKAVHRAGAAWMPDIEASLVEECAGQGVSGVIGGRHVRVGRLRWLRSLGVPLGERPPDAVSFSLAGIVIDGHHAATLGLADQVRSEAAEALERLRALGIERMVLLTGDRQTVAEGIASRLGLAEFKAECLPEDKMRYIEELKASGATVMVVGDGLNDAPALAAGHLGVAMGALGNDVAIHTADVALMNNDLRRLADLLELSHRTVGVINQNLLCGFLFIIAAVTLSTLGWISPIVAAFVHEFSAFFVIFNSARLLRFDGLVDEDKAETEPCMLEPIKASA